MKLSKLKIAEIRINSKSGIVQIKMNRGPNHIIEGVLAVKFERLRNAYMCDGNSHSVANLLAGKDYLEGRL